MTRTLSLALLLTASATTQAQSLCQSIASRCEAHITTNYIPDGQFYRALLQGDETAEFQLTLFGGTTYRIAACSGDSDGILLFSVFDQERNLLYTNKDHHNAPFWDAYDRQHDRCDHRGQSGSHQSGQWLCCDAHGLQEVASFSR